MSEIETEEQFYSHIPSPNKIDNVKEVIKFTSKIKDEIIDIKAEKVKKGETGA